MPRADPVIFRIAVLPGGLPRRCDRGECVPPSLFPPLARTNLVLPTAQNTEYTTETREELLYNKEKLLCAFPPFLAPASQPPY